MVQRALIILSLFIAINCSAQYRNYYVGYSEYFSGYVLNSTQKAYTISAVGSIVSGLSNVTYATAGPHNMAFITGGQIYINGDNTDGQLGVGTTGGSTGTFAVVPTDSAGNTFNNVTQMYWGASSSASTFGWAWLAVKGDGTLWACGGLYGGWSNSNAEGIRNRPIQIVMPGGVAVAKVALNQAIFILDVNGKVWVLGGNTGEFQIAYMVAQGTNSPNYYTVTAVSGLKSPIRDIAAGMYWEYAVTATGDSVYACGRISGPICLSNAHQTNSPGIDTYWSSNPHFLWIDNQLNFPAHVKNIYANTMTSYAILKDGSLWAWGDDTHGSAGIGTQLNYATYTTPYYGPFSVNFTSDTTVFIPRPVRVAYGKNDFDTAFSCASWTFGSVFEDSTGRLFAMGRNKGGIMGDQIQSCDDPIGTLPGNLPDSWNRPWITPWDSLSQSQKLMTSPLCITTPATSGCSATNCSQTGAQSPVANLVMSFVGKSQLKWDASGSTDWNHIWGYLVTQTSGPDLVGVLGLGVQAQPVHTIKKARPGYYTFSVLVNNVNILSNSKSATGVVPILRTRWHR